MDNQNMQQFPFSGVDQLWESGTHGEKEEGEGKGGKWPHLSCHLNVIA